MLNDTERTTIPQNINDVIRNNADYVEKQIRMALTCVPTDDDKKSLLGEIYSRWKKVFAVHGDPVIRGREIPGLKELNDALRAAGGGGEKQPIHPDAINRCRKLAEMWAETEQSEIVLACSRLLMSAITGVRHAGEKPRFGACGEPLPTEAPKWPWKETTI